MAFRCPDLSDGVQLGKKKEAVGVEARRRVLLPIVEGGGKRSIVQEVGAIEREGLRFGLHGLKSDLVGTHPHESAYHSAKRTEVEMKRRILANRYGTAFPLKIDLDRQILSRSSRV